MEGELLIEVTEPDADADVVHDLTAGLRRELLDLDVESVSAPPAGAAPPGTKGVDLAAVGELVVQLKGSVEVVATVLATLRAWLHRSPSTRRTVKITLEGRTLELSAASAEQQQRLVETFLRSLPGDGVSGGGGPSR
jgi:hypothetical protein